MNFRLKQYFKMHIALEILKYIQSNCTVLIISLDAYIIGSDFRVELFSLSIFEKISFLFPQLVISLGLSKAPSFLFLHTLKLTPCLFRSSSLWYTKSLEISSSTLNFATFLLAMFSWFFVFGRDSRLRESVAQNVLRWKFEEYKSSFGISKPSLFWSKIDIESCVSLLSIPANRLFEFAASLDGLFGEKWLMFNMKESDWFDQLLAMFLLSSWSERDRLVDSLDSTSVSSTFSTSDLVRIFCILMLRSVYKSLSTDW